MNNKLKIMAVALCAFGIGFGVNNYAMSDVPSKIAVVDVTKVTNASAQVKAWRTERENKVKEVTNFRDKAVKDIAATTDAKKRQDLEAKYTKEYKSKIAAADKELNSKLADIDAKITAVIKEQAIAGNYDVVLAKGAVLYGGTDITDAVSKEVAKTAQPAKVIKSSQPAKTAPKTNSKFKK